jgi:hypothetical protein
MRVSYSTILLVALKSRCTIYLYYSLLRVRSRTPTPTPCLHKELSKKSVQWGMVKTGSLTSGSLTFGPMGGMAVVSSMPRSQLAPNF